MGVKQYQKLVRDHIPEIIEADGKTCVTKSFSNEAYLQILDAKLNEALAEYQEGQSLEELADLLEVIQSVVIARGWSWEQLERVRAEKIRNAFFTLFEEMKMQANPSFADIAERLYQVDGKHEFSFISKMLHTIDPKRPIYDQQVSKALHIHRTSQATPQRKIQEDTQILQQISSVYHALYELPEMQPVLSRFDTLLAGQPMSIEKKMDFILWAFGDVRNS